MLIKTGLEYAPPLLFGGLRTLIAGITLLALGFLRREPVIPPKKDWKGILLLAFVGATLVGMRYYVHAQYKAVFDRHLVDPSFFQNSSQAGESKPVREIAIYVHWCDRSCRSQPIIPPEALSISGGWAYNFHQTSPVP
jgi:hypothetical protein